MHTAMPAENNPSTPFDILARFDQLLHSIGLSRGDAGGEVTFEGEDPIYPSVHRLGACISLPMMGSALAAAAIWRMRTGRGQDLSLDLRKAIHGINPLYRFKPTINGYAYQMPFALGNPLNFGLFLTKDGRWVLPTGMYPNQLQGWTEFLRTSPDPASMANAIAKWDAADLDEAAASKNMIFALCRSSAEWLAHPQGQLLQDVPVIEIIKIDDSEPEPFAPEATRPLAGLRVMSATHVIAGNMASRTLAEQGAEVLHIVRPQEFEHELLYVDPCVGFRSAWLDLKDPAGNRREWNSRRRPMCSWKATATGLSRSSGYRRRHWPNSGRVSSTRRCAATATTVPG